MMSEEFPFRTEYAKSNRSSCKLCEKAISKDSLRLAKMVQSPKFDGKIPNWFHYNCFFKVARITNISQVAGLGSLRWEDQQKLRDKASGGADDTDEEEEVDAPTSARPASDFTFEVARSGRSSCRLCGQKIPNNSTRVYYMFEYALECDGEVGRIPYYHHLKCFAEGLSGLNAIGIDPQQIQCFAQLSQERQKEVLEVFPLPTSSGKKRKGLDKEKGKGGTKKKPKEDPMEMVLRLQSEKLWKVRDELQSSLSQAELKSMLEANHQDIPPGESRLLDRCADGMVFGALEPCSTCSGQLIVGTHMYICTGNISSWTKCQVKTREAPRKEWVIPRDLKVYSSLKIYKNKPEIRVFPPVEESVDSSPSSTTKKLPLHGFTVFLVGRLSKTKETLTSQVQKLGGKIVSTVQKETTICISYKDIINSGNKKMSDVRRNNVPVVDVDFLADAAKGEALSKILPHTISPWGAPRHTLAVPEETDFDTKAFEKESGKMKLQLKKGSVVDPDSGLAHSHHVLELPPKTLYNAVLGMVDIVKGTNSYYKLQVLESDGGGEYQLFRAWGRVGTTIGGNKLEDYGNDQDGAMQAFAQLYADKTGNLWANRQYSTKVAGKFYPLEVEYDEDDESSLKLVTSADSKLAPEIQQLVKMIFDVDTMKKAMAEFEIDMKKMPLGKLSKRQMQRAFIVLSTLLAEINGARDPSRILDGSNQFYTLIPHDFGMQKPPLLDSEDAIKNKTMMVDNLMEIELAYRFLKEAQSVDKAKNPLDVHFEQLKTDMEVISKDSDEFKMIVEYVANTHAATHDSYDLEVMEVFQVARHGESKRFEPFSKLHNRMLLWHGSRTTNFVGILSQGLRIAPPEAPVSGYMFGKGVYFADMVSKSANYCRTSPNDNISLMLLCEVALGNMYEKTHSEYVSKLPKDKHSTKGIGRTMPNPQGYRTTSTGAIIPMGKGISSSVTYTSLLYNEYIVYDVKQINMQYLLKVKFNYRSMSWW